MFLGGEDSQYSVIVAGIVHRVEMVMNRTVGHRTLCGIREWRKHGTWTTAEVDCMACIAAESRP